MKHYINLKYYKHSYVKYNLMFCDFLNFDGLSIAVACIQGHFKPLRPCSVSSSFNKGLRREIFFPSHFSFCPALFPILFTPLSVIFDVTLFSVFFLHSLKPFVILCFLPFYISDLWMYKPRFSHRHLIIILWYIQFCVLLRFKTHLKIMCLQKNSVQ